MSSNTITIARLTDLAADGRAPTLAVCLRAMRDGHLWSVDCGTRESQVLDAPSAESAIAELATFFDAPEDVAARWTAEAITRIAHTLYEGTVRVLVYPRLGKLHAVLTLPAVTAPESGEGIPVLTTAGGAQYDADAILRTLAYALGVEHTRVRCDSADADDSGEAWHCTITL